MPSDKKTPQTEAEIEIDYAAEGEFEGEENTASLLFKMMNGEYDEDDDDDDYEVDDVDDEDDYEDEDVKEPARKKSRK